MELSRTTILQWTLTMNRGYEIKFTLKIVRANLNNRLTFYIYPVNKNDEGELDGSARRLK